MTCRYSTKRGYATRDLAREGANQIRLTVELRGGSYDTLYPYRCPDAKHWHLSHYRQGYADCTRCESRKPAWDGGMWWVMAEHINDHTEGRCEGSGLAGRWGGSVRLRRAASPAR